MNLELASESLWALDKGEHRTVYTSINRTGITVERTDKICPHDFAAGLLIPGRPEFRPTHIRLLFDLYLKRLSNPGHAKKLFGGLDLVYKGEDPSKVSLKIEKLRFPMQLDDPDTNLYYAQLLMIEQDFNYGPRGCKKTNFDPPREFLMRFFRWVASGESEIDGIIFTATPPKFRAYPPPTRYAQWDPSWIEPV